MAKKVLLVLVIAVLAATGAFAQNDFASMAKNTFTVDFGPTIFGFVVNPLSSTLSSMIDNVISDIDTKGFSIAAQYERQILRQVSVAGRFVYGGYESIFTYRQDGTPITATPVLNLTSLAVEGHARFYPFGETFFLDGMVGYAHLSTMLSGSVVAKIGSIAMKTQITPPVSLDNNYLKFGGKLGWRMTFGKNGGPTLETAIGYYLGASLGDDLGKRVSAGLKESVGEFDTADISGYFSQLEQFVLIGGPRVTLALGYRF
jgi:hypothetical protein